MQLIVKTHHKPTGNMQKMLDAYVAKSDREAVKEYEESIPYVLTAKAYQLLEGKLK